MPLSEIPPEVVQIICGHLGRKDLCSLRLTCTLYADAAARALFSSVHLMFREKSFKNIISIAAHPIFRHYVNRIFYEAIRPEEPRTQEEWEAQVGPPASADDKIMSDMPERPSDLGERAMRLYRRAVKKWVKSREAHNFYSREKLDDAWRAYCEIYEETLELEMNCDDFMAIRTAFVRFDRLKSITMSTFSDFSMYNISDEIKQAYEPALILPGFLRDKDSQEEIAMGARFFKSLVSGMLMAKEVGPRRRFESFEVDCVDWEVFSPNPDPVWEKGPNTLYEPSPPSEWHPAFVGLKRLRLDLAPDMYTSGWHSVRRHERLGELLQVTCPDLEELYLTFGDVYSARENREYVEPVLFDRLVGDKTFPKLKILRLHIADVNEDFFVDFMNRHQATLKELDLAGLWVRAGDWPSTFLRLKEPWGNLEDLCLGGAFGMGERDDGTEIILPMQCHLETDWTEAEHMHKKHLADYVEDYFLKDARFPLRTVAEAEKMQLFPDASALIDIPSFNYPRGWLGNGVY